MEGPYLPVPTPPPEWDVRHDTARAGSAPAVAATRTRAAPTHQTPPTGLVIVIIRSGSGHKLSLAFNPFFGSEGSGLRSQSSLLSINFYPRLFAPDLLSTISSIPAIDNKCYVIRAWVFFFVLNLK